MRIYIFILSFLVVAGTLIAQESALKLFLQDGNTIEKQLSEIESLTFKNAAVSSIMTIYRGNDSADVVFDTESIDSLIFTEKLSELIVFKRFNVFYFPLANIDSITIIPTGSETVTICNQVWMAKNLDVDRYRNGEPIRHAETAAEWKDANDKQEGAWCYYDNDPANGEIYGKLYNWYAVIDPRGLAPEGWHVPTDGEWKELEMCLGMSQEEADNISWRGTDQGSQLAGRADLWIDGALENNAAFGSSGFSALPGGLRLNDSTFYRIGYNGLWRSSSELNATSTWTRYLSYNSSEVSRRIISKGGGVSVRVVRD